MVTRGHSIQSGTGEGNEDSPDNDQKTPIEGVEVTYFGKLFIIRAAAKV